MRYMLEDALDYVVIHYTPKQYVYATMALLVVALFVSAVCAIPGLWLAALSLALAMPVTIAAVCVFGALLKLNGRRLHENLRRTLVLAFLSAAAAAVFNWLFIVPFLYFGAWGPVWLQLLCAIAAFAWTVSLICFAVRRRLLGRV